MGMKSRCKILRKTDLSSRNLVSQDVRISFKNPTFTDFSFNELRIRNASNRRRNDNFSCLVVTLLRKVFVLIHCLTSERLRVVNTQLP